MKTETRDIWLFKDTHWIVIPTNLQGPMGRGLAYQANKRFPGLEKSWKKHCREGEEKPVFWDMYKLILFPVKYKWKNPADLDLVENSLKSIEHWNELTALPQIGCGFGERNWETEIYPLVKKYLSKKDNFTLVIMSESVRSKYSKSFLPVRKR